MAIRRGCLYVVGNRENGLYKIGISRYDPRNRMKDLQSFCPLELELVYHLFVRRAVEMERLVHTHFKTQRLFLGGRLTEWFKLSKEELHQILSLIPKEQIWPEQQLDQDHRKGAAVYRPVSSYFPGAGLIIGDH